MGVGWGGGCWLLHLGHSLQLRCGLGPLLGSAPKEEVDSEIWGKGVCDIWEKWASRWRNENTCVSGERSRFLGALFEGGAAEGGGACIASRIATSTDGGRSIPSHAAICVISANRNANRSQKCKQLGCDIWEKWVRRIWEKRVSVGEQTCLSTRSFAGIGCRGCLHGKKNVCDNMGRGGWECDKFEFQIGGNGSVTNL